MIIWNESSITGEVKAGDFQWISVPVGQYLPASSENYEERCGQDEESLQLPGKDHISPSISVEALTKAEVSLCHQVKWIQ